MGRVVMPKNIWEEEVVASVPAKFASFTDLCEATWPSGEVSTWNRTVLYEPDQRLVFTTIMGPHDAQYPWRTFTQKGDIELKIEISSICRPDHWRSRASTLKLSTTVHIDVLGYPGNGQSIQRKAFSITGQVTNDGIISLDYEHAVAETGSAALIPLLWNTAARFNEMAYLMNWFPIDHNKDLGP